MKNSNIKICNEVIYPGEQANLALPLPELYSCSPLYMPIKVLHGKLAGPSLLIFSALRGNELNGFEIINRLINDYELEKNLSGTLIAIPVVNVYALTQVSNEIPADISIESSFPGDAEGSYGERFAYLFTQEILKKVETCIEITTGEVNHTILPQIYANIEDKNIQSLAQNFNVPVATTIDMHSNSLRKTINALNIDLLVYEAGEALRFDENAIQLGIKGILNVLRTLNMLPDDPAPSLSKISFSHTAEWIRAPKGGVLNSTVQLGQIIQKDEIMGYIADPFGNTAKEPIHSQQDGIIVGINNHPLLHEGQPIYKLASFIDNERANNCIEKWGEHIQSSL